MDGRLFVFHTGDERWGEFHSKDRAEAVLADDFGGIPSDGGGW